MKVMLTNDDGIHAPGIVALHDALQGLFDELVVVAPLTVQSATSHGVTFHQPLMASDIRVNERMTGIAVDGRPADCVKVGLAQLWPERFGPGSLPDLVISGMNAGANCGINVIYSGTVAAAIEAAFLGVPSIAVSLHMDTHQPAFDLAAGHARIAIERILEQGVPGKHECLNVNIPRTERERPESLKMPEIVVCPMNTHGLNDKYEARETPSGERYFWSAGHGLDFANTDIDTDVAELFERKITVTPLKYDLTRYEELERWRARLAGAGARAAASK